MAKGLKQIFTEEITGVKEEQTKIDERDFSNRKPDELRYKKSISLNITYVAMSLVLILIFLIPDESQKPRIMDAIQINWFFGIFLVSIPTSLIYFATRSILDRKDKLIVNERGIWTPNFELEWKSIESTFFRFVQGKTIFLVVKTKNNEKKIDLGEFAVNTRFLGHQIELMKIRSEEKVSSRVGKGELHP